MPRKAGCHTELKLKKFVGFESPECLGGDGLEPGEQKRQEPGGWRAGAWKTRGILGLDGGPRRWCSNSGNVDPNGQGDHNGNNEEPAS